MHGSPRNSIIIYRHVGTPDSSGAELALIMAHVYSTGTPARVYIAQGDNCYNIAFHRKSR